MAMLDVVHHALRVEVKADLVPSFLIPDILVLWFLVLSSRGSVIPRRADKAAISVVYETMTIKSCLMEVSTMFRGRNRSITNSPTNRR
jgi:hypothetical protein